MNCFLLIMYLVLESGSASSKFKPKQYVKLISIITRNSTDKKKQRKNDVY
jgi:hypothetical protein